MCAGPPSGRVFPVPPLQQLGVVVGLRSVVHGAPEYVKDAPVHVVARFTAEFGVKRLGVAASEVRHVSNPQPVEIPGYRRSNSGDALDRPVDRPGGLSYLSDHTASSFPFGSVK